MRATCACAAAFSALVSGPAAAQHAAHHANSDSAAVATVIERIHAALTAGDSAAALALLAPHVMIADAGRIETRAEYRAHHLPGDIVFAQAVKSERKPVQVRVRGDVAWAIAATSLQGTYRDRAIDALGAELIVLTRAGDRWLITAIHWSSRQRHRRP